MRINTIVHIMELCQLSRLSIDSGQTRPTCLDALAQRTEWNPSLVIFTIFSFQLKLC